MELLLTRFSTSDQGTFGILTCGTFQCYTGELPDRNNTPRKSCVPVGTYEVENYSSKKYPNSFHILDVPKRSLILIHKGNYCGDVDKGFRSDVLGCVIVGDRIGTLKTASGSQDAVLSSAGAFLRLQKLLDGAESVKITIKYKEVGNV